MPEPAIYREEVVGVLFAMNDRAEAPRDIRNMLREDDDGEEEEDEG